MESVTDALKKQYNANIMLLVQQMTSLLAQSVYQKPDCGGEESYQDQLASETAQEKTARNQTVVNTDPQYARRKIVPRYFYMAPLVDKFDKLQLLTDPTNELTQNNAAALARAKDEVVADSFTALAYTGKAGTSSISLPSTQIITASSAGLNLVKIIAAARILNKNEVPADNRYFACSAEQIEDLLGITEVNSSDYASVKALVDGKPGTLVGFQFLRSERLNTDSSSTYRQCAAYHKTGIVLGTWIEMLTSIDILPAKHFSAQVYAGQSYGATRLEEEKVVLVECAE